MILQEAVYLGMMFGIMIILIVFLTIWCVVGVVVALWIYNDAKERENMDETVWALIGLLLGLFGLIIYILLRE